jgi:alkyl hydroperoxide reductase subunit AhpF
MAVNSGISQEFAPQDIDVIADERTRLIMQFVRDMIDRLVEMDDDAGATALMSVLATICRRCPDPVQALEILTSTVRGRLVLAGTAAEGHG